MVLECFFDRSLHLINNLESELKCVLESGIGCEWRLFETCVMWKMVVNPGWVILLVNSEPEQDLCYKYVQLKRIDSATTKSIIEDNKHDDDDDSILEEPYQTRKLTVLNMKKEYTKVLDEKPTKQYDTCVGGYR